MPGILKSTVSTYAFTLDQMAALIAADLEVSIEQIKVSYTLRDDTDDRFGGGSVYSPSVVGVTVEVNHPALAELASKEFKNRYPQR